MTPGRHTRLPLFRNQGPGSRDYRASRALSRSRQRVRLAAAGCSDRRSPTATLSADKWASGSPCQPALHPTHTSPRASSGRRKMWKGRSMPGRCARLPNRKRVVVRVCALAAQDAHPKQEAVEALEEEVGAESHTDSSSRCDHHGAVMMPPM